MKGHYTYEFKVVMNADRGTFESILNELGQQQWYISNSGFTHSNDCYMALLTRCIWHEETSG